jgi:hypothetical protein
MLPSFLLLFAACSPVVDTAASGVSDSTDTTDTSDSEESADGSETADTAGTDDSADSSDTADSVDSADSGDTGDTAPIDADKDGFPEGVDCDDGDVSVHPGAVETPYDGIDQDCDGADLEDVDGDGYVLAEDCDDTNGTIHPGATETPYDGIDQDCDGTDLIDVDGDGYALADDCDDEDASIHPGATETPYDGIDQDCDGLDLVDVDGDGYPLADDCDDEDASVHPEASEVARNGLDDDCDGYVDLDAGSLDDASTFWTTDGDDASDSDYLLGRGGMALGPDVDGDGVQDIFVLAWEGYGIPSSYTGSSWNAEDDAVVILDPGDDYLGAVVATDDADSDGTSGIVVARQGPVGAGSDVLVYASPVLSGVIDAESASGSIALDDGRLSGVDNNSIDAVDLDGDGLEELVLGDEYYQNAAGDYTGRVLVFELPITGAISDDDADALLFASLSGSSSFGQLVKAVGDVDGDGLPDLFVGDVTGRIVSGAIVSGYVSVLSAEVAEMEGPGGHRADAVSGADVDGDGHSDVIVQNTNDITYGGTTSRGSALVFTSLYTGGSRADDDAEGAMVCSDGGVLVISNFGSLRDSGSDIAVTYGLTGGDSNFVALVPDTSVPTAGILDLSTWGDFLSTGDVMLGYGGQLLLVDADGDAVDDLLATNPGDELGYAGSPSDYYPPGVLAIFPNPR